ncbi:cation transport protein ChaC [Strigomonas culicis]|uniref:glutathione-specific gamma-glutamylcyclotransferase n=1 Tax=Strigomonas culicis TaxID=28005 RepID=S9UN54_9TRYP|nr:cation transport protein ChaC [Strigomonas culicis]|eukprot:EPY30368.1 cation transport protein ChaC [Strigomonas culicis]
MTGDNLHNTKLSQQSTAVGGERFGLPSFEDHTFLIFGYGSILWKQNFDYVQAYPCYIKGYDRVFYQGTCEHRGTPGAPGRVVTLLPSADAEQRVYGMAYELPADPAVLTQILGDLDVREQEGYDRVSVDLFEMGEGEVPLPLGQETGKKVVTLCYIATEGNSDYLGAASVDDMAAHILRCAGPSGTNREYLFRLAECLRAIGAVDEHVFAIDAAAKRQLREQAEPAAVEDDVKPSRHSHSNATSTVRGQLQRLSVNKRAHKAGATPKYDGIRVRG